MKNIKIRELTSLLKEKGVKPSLQRLKILEYLFNNENHPTVDQIYNDLNVEIPTLSKTTVYNTLNVLIDAGLVKVVNIESSESRYEGISAEHGHFKCKECGKIYDLEFDMELIDKQVPPGFKVSEKDIYFKGICKDCFKVNEKNKNN